MKLHATFRKNMVFLHQVKKSWAITTKAKTKLQFYFHGVLRISKLLSRHISCENVQNKFENMITSTK